MRVEVGVGDYEVERFVEPNFLVTGTPGLGNSAGIAGTAGVGHSLGLNGLTVRDPSRGSSNGNNTTVLIARIERVIYT